jgi:hypothetical protein
MKQHTGRNAFFVLMLAILSFSGCAEEQRLALPEASLKGKVTFKGKPVPYALIVITGRAGSATGNADADGNYVIERVYPGEVEVGVNTDAGKGNMMGASMAAAQGGDKSAKPTFVDVPSKYFDPTTSGIKTTVPKEKGETVFDIVIK